MYDDRMSMIVKVSILPLVRGRARASLLWASPTPTQTHTITIPLIHDDEYNPTPIHDDEDRSNQ